MGKAALTGLSHVAAMPGAVDAAAGLLQHGQQAAQKAALLAAQRKALEAAKLRNQDLKEKRQDDLVNAAAVKPRPFPGCTRPCISVCLQASHGLWPALCLYFQAQRYSVYRRFTCVCRMAMAKMRTMFTSPTGASLSPAAEASSVCCHFAEYPDEITLPHIAIEVI
jgi:hypothetical protein